MICNQHLSHISRHKLKAILPQRESNKIKFDIVSALHNFSNGNLLHLLFVLQINKVLKGWFLAANRNKLQQSFYAIFNAKSIYFLRVNIGPIGKCHGINIRGFLITTMSYDNVFGSRFRTIRCFTSYRGSCKLWLENMVVIVNIFPEKVKSAA